MFYKIDEKTLLELLENSNRYEALCDYGVDNWDGYEEALNDETCSQDLNNLHVSKVNEIDELPELSYLTLETVSMLETHFKNKDLEITLSDKEYYHDPETYKGFEDLKSKLNDCCIFENMKIITMSYFIFDSFGESNSLELIMDKDNKLCH